MAIRFDSEFNSEIRRVVRNFNQKRNRAAKRGFHYLPPPVSISELKGRYSSRNDLKKELTALRNFNDEGDKALKVVETSGGAKAIKWQLYHIKKNLKAAKAFYDKEIKDLSKLDTDLLVMKSEELFNLKEKRAYLEFELDNLNQQQFRTFQKTMDEYFFHNERINNGYRGWMNEVEVIMRVLGYDNKTIDKFFEGFDALTPSQFTTMYRQNDLISRIYELYIPTADHSFQLSTTEEDAKRMIETFIEQKDDMIAKVKAHELADDRPLEEFVEKRIKSLSKPVRRNGRTKLKRSSLTPKEIKDLQDLGWEDLIE